MKYERLHFDQTPNHKTHFGYNMTSAKCCPSHQQFIHIVKIHSCLSGKYILVDHLQYFITMLKILVVDNSFSNHTNKLTNASPFSLSFSLFYFLSGHCTSSLRVIRSRLGRLGQKRNDSRLSIKMMHLPVASAVRPSLQMAVGIYVPTARPSSVPAVGEEYRCAQIT